MSSAVPDHATHADTVEKIGDLAASAGIRRVHVLAWRDLDDDEAGGSEVHIHEVARRWAEAGIEVTMRTSHAQRQAGGDDPRRLPDHPAGRALRRVPPGRDGRDLPPDRPP